MHHTDYPFPIVRKDNREMAVFASGDSHDLAALLADMVRRARRAIHPNKSLAATLRERGLKLTHAERAALFDAALEQLAAASGIVPGREWLTVVETARHLDRPVREIVELLNTTQGRRELGWPWQVGQTWRIPAAAIYADTRARYMSSLPETDPYDTSGR
jgi:hypothetical protein